MIFYPAIDIKDGKCVRLLYGDMEQVTVFSDDPVSQAKSFEDCGTEWIHIVDLNGAFAGTPVNADVIEDIVSSVDVKIQLGGGIRNIEIIEAWLNAGVSRVVLGTVAVQNPEIVKEACRKFPDKIAVGIDVKDGKVAIGGWEEKTEIGALELAKMYEDAGVAAIIYTNINHDGAMIGSDINGTKTLAESISIPVIASGGVSSIGDLKSLKDRIPSLNGVISGRALYDKKIDVKEAVALMNGN